jgi:glutamyl/glutaminyl-tRNA synthetase
MAYRGRIAPSPTGRLHEGHFATFGVAQARARSAGGTLILRIEDLDRARCRPEFVRGCLEDLQAQEFSWDEGPDVGGACGPYVQSERRALHLEVWRRLLDLGTIYPCSRSRKDVAEAAGAPHIEGEEPIYPAAFRPEPGTGRDAASPVGVNWRFRVPDGRVVGFSDSRCGERAYTAGVDFGDFLVWRLDDTPAYQLAVVADDAAMGVTEVVRGEDLLVSTARQILLYEALGLPCPAWHHCSLVLDEQGRRLSKRRQGA